MPEAPAFGPTIAARLAFLESELAAKGSDSVEVALQGLPVNCFLGVDALGSVVLRISCDPRNVTSDDTAVAVSVEPVPSGCRITMRPSAQRHAATNFLEEVIQLVREGHPPGDAGRAALQNWRELLATPPGAPLSDGALAGLYGELEVLLMVLEAGGDIAHWTGWDRDQNDFRLPGLVIEVKATTSPNYRRVTVHGLRQLADPEDGSDLVLVLRRLEASPDGRSVPDLIDEAVKLGASRSVMLDRLSRVDYSDLHRAHYQSRRFVSQEIALRAIDEAHPRLTPAELDRVDLSAIDRVDYVLNLNADADADSDLRDELEPMIRRTLESP